MVNAIIFDFDGVVLESLNVKTNAFKKLYEPYGSDISKKVVEHHLENGGVSRFDKIKFYHNIFFTYLSLYFVWNSFTLFLSSKFKNLT